MEKQKLSIHLAKYIAEDNLLELAHMAVMADKILKQNDCFNLKEILEEK